MFIPHKTKKSKFYKEVSPENQKTFFGIIQKKILPTIDNIYYSVFVKNDDCEETIKKLMPLLEKLQSTKTKVRETHEPQPFTNGLVVTLKSAGKAIFDVCLTEMDIYDIFINSSEKLPNSMTPRIHNQLRAFGLWTRGVDAVLDESFKKTESILGGYDIEISHVQENRIDYCYHTNIKADVDKIFDKRKKDFKHLQYSLEGGFSHFTKEKSDTMFHNYYMFGKKDGDWLVRFYDKVKEVIENGYKSFFFKMWHDNNMISFYDRYCMEYALPYKNADYIHKAKLAFYVEYGTDSARRKEYEKALNSKSKSLSDYKRIASEFMPPANPVINIEFQTNRDFYRHSDDWINRRETLERDCHPQLKRIYQIIDNRKIFLEYLTGKGFYFADGKQPDGTPNYLDWWKRIHKAEVGGIKADERLLRKYENLMDNKVVKRSIIGSVASLAVRENVEGTDFVCDFTNMLQSLTDNQAHQMDKLLIVESNGEIVDTLKSQLLDDYAVIKARKEMRFKNRKVNKDNKATDAGGEYDA